MAADVNDEAARAAFADYLLQHGGVLDADFDEFLVANASMRDDLVRLARIWSGSSTDGAPPPPESAPPREIAGFRIVREIGRGGMGIVYEAEQDRPRRRVALKVVRGEFVDRERMKRMELESQVLALLKHPSIVPLFGSGRTADGSPWFAMEYVIGLPLDEAIERRVTGIESRLSLFRQICDAIAYAHQKGVIHRDLKPSNIVLSEETLSASGDRHGVGQVKILDFGLARITDADVTMVSMPSDAGHIVGTLAYMSPEQVRGRTDDVDQRSDVYALGVLLYEMLTGQRPYDLDGCWLGEAAERIENTDPKRPGSIDRRLRGDLDTILLKALAKDPQRRYQSVSSLAEDVDRYQQGLPILAHPPSAAYQLKKLVLRHKAQAAAAGVLLASLFVVAALLVWHSNSLARERDVAAAVMAFQEGMLASVDPGRNGRDVKVIDVLAQAARELDAGAHAATPVVEGALRHTIGMTYENLGLYAEAEPQLERALALRREHLGPTHHDTLISMNHLANLRQGQHRLDEAESLYREALQIYDEKHGVADPGTLTVRSNLGLLLEKRGDLDGAEQHLTAVLDARRRILGDDHSQVAFSLSHLGALHRRFGRLESAERLLGEAHTLRRDNLGDDHPETMTAANNLGLVLQAKGLLNDAESLLAETLERRRSVLGDDHPDTWTSMGNVASAWLEQGRQLDAVEMAREVVARKSLTLGDDHGQTLTAISNLAVLLKKLGHFEEAEPLARQVLEDRRRVLGDDHPDTIRSLSNLASLLVMLGPREREEAEALARVALTGVLARFGEESVPTVTVRNTLAYVLHRQEQFHESEQMFQRSFRTLETLVGAEHPHSLTLANNLASALRAQCRTEETKRLLGDTLSLAELHHPASLTAGLLHSNVGMTSGDEDAFTTAEDHLLTGHAILVQNVGPDQQNTRIIEAALHKLYTRWGLEDRATRYRPLEDAAGAP